LCTLYPPACGSGSFLAAKRPPKSSPPAPAPARQTGLAALQASDYAIGHEYVATVPAGGSTDVPVDFEGVNEATPFVISDQIDSLNVSYGLTTFAPDQLLGALDVLTATIPQPGSGSIHVVNSNAAAAATVRIVLGLQTTRQLAVTAAPALVRPGSPVTLTATLGDSV